MLCLIVTLRFLRNSEGGAAPQPPSMGPPSGSLKIPGGPSRLDPAVQWRCQFDISVSHAPCLPRCNVKALIAANILFRYLVIHTKYETTIFVDLQARFLFTLC